MRHISGRFLSVFLEETFMVQVPVLAIHGGAGTINREALSAEAEREYRGRPSVHSGERAGRAGRRSLRP